MGSWWLVVIITEIKNSDVHCMFLVSSMTYVAKISLDISSNVHYIIFTVVYMLGITDITGIIGIVAIAGIICVMGVICIMAITSISISL